MQSIEYSQLEEVNNLIAEHCNKASREMLKENEFVTHYPKNAVIFREGTTATTIQFINEGRVKVISRYNGKERIIRLADEGKIIGHRSFGGDSTYFASAVALSSCIVTSYPLDIFEKVLIKNPKFCLEFLKFFAEELRISEKRIERLSYLPVLNRVAYALVMNVEYFGLSEEVNPNHSNFVNHVLSRKDIAGIALTTYESVIRSLAELEKQNLIEIVGKKIKVQNYEKLRDLILLDGEKGDHL